MGIAQRMTEVFKAKANTVLERAEDPRELLDYSYALQLELLHRMKRGLVDVATARKRAENRLNQSRAYAEHLQHQAEHALAAGHTELAHQTLTRRALILQRADEMDRRHTTLRRDEEGLTTLADRLSTRVEAFGTHKEALKAGYTLAEAEACINETLAGISEEMTDAGLHVRRAEDKTAQTRARASALDELLESGTLRDAFSGVIQETVPADLQVRLDELTRSEAVEEELEKIRERLRGRSSASPGPAERPERPAGE
jgi:phage shock protein A